MRILADPLATTSQAPVPAFEITRARPVSAPVIFASPHSGAHYPPSMRAQLSVPISDLRRTEDAFVDELYDAAPELGSVLLSGTYARAYVDLNRDARELDVEMFADGPPRTAGMPSARVKAGLGCLPKVGASGRPIYSAPISQQEGAFRLTHVHDRYHQALRAEIETLKQTWSDVFIIDCHSMPSRQPGRPNMPDIVLGDRFGSSCSARLTSMVERYFRRENLSVARNAPYAGGYTTRRYGRPRRGTHVLQIEINRGLYMDELKIKKSRGFQTLKRQLTGLVEGVQSLAIAENG